MCYLTIPICWWNLLCEPVVFVLTERAGVSVKSPANDAMKLCDRNSHVLIWEIHELDVCEVQTEILNAPYDIAVFFVCYQSHLC